MDGVAIEGFANNRVDNEIAKKWSIHVFPALFIVNPQKDDIVPIAFGLISLDQIEENVLLQISHSLETLQ
jgi:conjugal transfer pilus assembly protein TraF